MAYKTVITNDGAAALNAITGSQKINLPTFSVGVGTAASGQDLKTLTELVDKKYTTTVSEIIPSADHVAIKCVIPPDVPTSGDPGKYIDTDITIRELGIYDDNGKMCVYSVVPDTLRPISTSGAGTETVITALVKFQGSSISVTVDPDSTATKSDFSTLVEKHQVPVGAIVPFNSATAPVGWLLCNGATIQKSVYPDLVKHLNGGDEDAVSANLPNLLGEFVRGWSGNQNGAPDAGRVLGSKQADEFKEHNHLTVFNSGVPNDKYGNVYGSPNTYNVATEVGPGESYTSTSGGSETRPRNVALAYYIKAYGEVTNSGNINLTNALTKLNEVNNNLDKVKAEVVIDKEFNDLTPVSEMTTLGVYPIQYYAYNSANKKSLFPDSYHVSGRSTFQLPSKLAAIKPWMKVKVTPKKSGTLLANIYFPARMEEHDSWGYIISKRVDGVTTVIRNSLLSNESGYSFGVKNNIDFTDNVTKGRSVEFLVTFFVTENELAQNMTNCSGINCAEYDVGVSRGANNEATRFTLNNLTYVDGARTYEGDPEHPLSLFNQVESRHGKCKIQAFII